jgi:uncharacterized protein YpmB
MVAVSSTTRNLFKNVSRKRSQAMAEALAEVITRFDLKTAAGFEQKDAKDTKSVTCEDPAQI